MKIDAFVGDITECVADAIMLGTNTQLQANDFICRASGLSVETYRTALEQRGRPLAVGQAIATAAGTLRVTCLIHVPLPVYDRRSHTDRPVQLLAAYHAGLQMADALKLRDLVIAPLINNFPYACAADVAVEAMRFCKVAHLKAAHLVSLDRDFMSLVLDRLYANADADAAE